MKAKLIQSWYQSTLDWKTRLLTPLAWGYQGGVVLRRKLYDWGWRRTHRFPIPIIVVGNITVGGTGKTPFVIWLVEQLKAEGLKPAVVSRGYGGRYQSLLQVEETHDSNEVGDEPLLIYRRCRVPVILARRRAQAAEYVVETTDCDCIVADDGLQHYALARDIEIGLVDGHRYFGNGLCLPAGPLREPKSRLDAVDFIVVNGDSETAHWPMRLQGHALQCLIPTQIQAPTPPQTVHAVAGIAHPERFFRHLESLGFRVIPHPFPDHSPFQRDTFQFNDNLPIVMTEKDAMRCQHFATERFWTLPVYAAVPHALFESIKTRLAGLLSYSS